MVYDSRYDDPKFITAFLSSMNGEDEWNQNIGTVSHQPDERAQNGVTGQDRDSKPSSGTHTPAVLSAVSSPHAGTRAPPPTPENAARIAVDIDHLSPIDEDRNENQDMQDMAGEQPRSPQQFRPTAQPFLPHLEEGRAGVLAHGTNMIVSTNNLAEGIKQDESVKTYHQQVFNKFKAQAEERIALKVSTNEVGYPAANHTANSGEHFENLSPELPNVPAIDQEFHAGFTNHDHTRTHTVSSDTTEPFCGVQDGSTVLSDGLDDEEDDDSSIDIIVDAPTSSDSFKSRKSIIAVTSPDNSPVQPVKESIPFDSITTGATNEANKPRITVKEEPREDATYFSTWGAPTARNIAPARVRKIVLSNLPPTADFTLALSLIHGGAIEVATLCPSSGGSINAFVTFASADACDAYYKKYPNGLELKHLGKKYDVFVAKGKDVDVIPGVLQSYLDCGATRVIKATGADEDWSMRALYKIAEGSGSRRKVEAIVDSYRNNNRTIIFRFTKIADAVTFRGQLLRTSDWQDADIHFMADPCENATGVHHE